MNGDVAIKRLLANHKFKTVLDVGAGSGAQATAFRRAGKEVLETDYKKDGDFNKNKYGKFDLVWASHILEHQLNVNNFLVNCRKCLNPGGLFCVTVPPAKDEIVGGHVTIWNPGLLVYNLILAGFNCREADIFRYGYNISVIVKDSKTTLPKLKYDNGDIKTLADFFPDGCNHGFDGWSIGKTKKELG